MAEFLTTKGVSYQIEKIIMEAKRKLILVSPFLQLSKTFYERLQDASHRGVAITIVYGKDELKPNQRNSLAELRNVKLYYSENLHAKCYFNELLMVITSMNMYEFSERNNREMGVLITKSADQEVFSSAVSETQSIIQSAERIQLSRSNRDLYQPQENRLPASGEQSNSTPSRGYCIRCESRIPFDPNRPYCKTCYSVWAQFENPFYQENVCHGCGQFEAASLDKPLCYTCFREVRVG
jgi:hypothetical protein